MRSHSVNGVTMIVASGDMTLEKVDAIVNAANSRLDHACQHRGLEFPFLRVSLSCFW